MTDDQPVPADGLRMRPGDQSLPVPNDRTDIQSLVIDDIVERRELGISRYGTALQPFNERDALLDAYQEALDLVMYLKQMLIERGPFIPDSDDVVAARVTGAVMALLQPNPQGGELVRPAVMRAVLQAIRPPGTGFPLSKGPVI